MVTDRRTVRGRRGFFAIASPRFDNYMPQPIRGEAMYGGCPRRVTLNALKNDVFYFLSAFEYIPNLQYYALS